MVPSSAGFLNPVYLLARCIAAMMKLEPKAKSKLGYDQVTGEFPLNTERGSQIIPDLRRHALFIILPGQDDVEYG